MLGTFVRSLEFEAPLPEDARTALLRLDVRKKEIRSARDLPRYEDIVLVERGLLARYIPLDDVKRAIVSLYINGDCYGLNGLARPLESRVTALCDSTFYLISADQVQSLSAKHPSITLALWRRSLTDMVFAQQWIVSLGHRDARARAAHLFWELLQRYEAAELAEQHSFPLPMKQSELADVFGLSVVHVNRILKQLRDEGVVELRKKQLHVKSRSKLRELTGSETLKSLRVYR